MGATLMADPRAFIAQNASLAQQVGQALGVDPVNLLGQWGLETGWGRSVIPGTNNLGNIKDLSGGGVAATDNQTGSTDRYRAYSNPADFGNDYADLISRRFPGVVGTGSDLGGFVAGLRPGQKGGYAEDPAYGNKLAGAVALVRRMGDTVASAVSGNAQAAPMPPSLAARLGIGDAQQAAPVAAAAPAPILDAGSAGMPASLAARLQGAPSAASAQPPQQAATTQPAAPSQGGGGVLNTVASAISGNANAATPDQAPQQRGFLDELGRQIGLTARAAGHGVADAVSIVGNPLNALINMATGSQLQDPGAVLRRGVDAVTPTPQKGLETVVNDVAGQIANPANLVAGPISNGAIKVGGVAGKVLSPLLETAVGRNALAGAVSANLQPTDSSTTLADIGTRTAMGAAGGVAGGIAGSALGKVGDTLATAANRIVAAVKSALPGGQAATMASVDQILSKAAQDSGIDLAAIPQSILNGVRTQVAGALNTGRTLDAASALRKAEGDAVLGAGNGLTLGQATRDAAQFTAEKNLRGVQGAGEPLMERYANQNTALINSLNNAGAAGAPGEYQLGQRAIDSLAARDAAMRGNVDQLYNQARSLNGGDIPLNGRQFADAALGQLDQGMAHAFLPEYYRGILNKISTGEMPLTVGVGEQLKTLLGNDIRASNNGNERFALGALRSALDQAHPLDNAAQAGGNQLVTQAQATARGPYGTGDAALSAFNQARQAAAERFGTIDSNPALKAVVNGDAVPDNFFKRYVLNGNVGDVNSLMSLVPDQGNALRSQVVDYLKQKALNGASDEIGTFSQSAFNKALNSIGDAKLNALFAPEQVAQLKQIGRVAANVQAQPAGSAVNNSNTGAAVMNLLSQMAGKVGGLPGINLARNSVTQFLNERAANQALAGQIQSAARPQSFGPLNQLLPLLPGIAGGASVPSGAQP
ncbi:glucosaminidase domain-containing protein [Ralstonia insidiosa]|uniref:glucosaminidase domain-containing protein n=1 Tax=Ralstonia insidiosa TaxID=190721 RepID=UPI000CED9470|nr:glucosaminidase domain-containing protein [Ralstonia insidiosa]